MNQKAILIFALLLSTCSAVAQNKCATALNKLIGHVEENYPGFEQKTSDKIGYGHFKAELLQKSQAVDEKECFPLLEKYISYFRDGHIFFLGQSNYLKTDKADRIEKLDLSRSLLKKISSSMDSLEGIWKNEQFKVGIVKSGGGYQGFIISSKTAEWQPGSILFNIGQDKAVRYFGADLTVFNDGYALKDPSTLFFTKLRTYFLKDMDDTASEAEISEKINGMLGFSVRKLTDKTVMVKLKSFDYPFVERIIKLIGEHKLLIENADNLILDLRDNGGGTTDAGIPLLPYLMSGKTRTMNVEYWISDFLISGMEKYLKGLDVKNSTDERQQLIGRLDFFRQNRGKFVLAPGTKPVEIDTFASKARSPRQIVILINKNVGSAAESLVLMAKQSKKVKLVGTPTHGILDYANAYLSGYEYSGHPLVLPTYRSLRVPDFPIDNIGIQPDVYLDKSVGDWIAYSIDYLEN